MALIDVNPHEEEPIGSYKALPPNTYACTIKGAEVRPTKTGAGSMLSLKFEVMEGDHTGRLIFTQHLLSHPSQQAREIGRRMIGQLLRALQLEGGIDTDELLGRELFVDVKVKQDDTTGELRNEVRNYPADLATPAASAATPAAAPKPAAKSKWAS